MTGKDNFKDTLSAVFDSILEQGRKQAAADPLFDFLSSKKQWFDDPETVGVMVYYPVDEIVQEVVRQRTGSRDTLVGALYTNYNFIEHNLSNLCSKLYGSAFSADRSRAVASRALSFKITGELADFDPSDSKNYHHPPTGSARQWVALVEGLVSLLYGHPDKYLAAYLELVRTAPQKDVQRPSNPGATV